MKKELSFSPGLNLSSTLSRLKNSLIFYSKYKAKFPYLRKRYEGKLGTTGFFTGLKNLLKRLTWMKKSEKPWKRRTEPGGLFTWVRIKAKDLSERLRLLDRMQFLIMILIVLIGMTSMITNMLRQDIMVESTTVDEIVAKWNGQQTNWFYLTTIYFMYCIPWVLCVRSLRPRKPQGRVVAMRRGK